jgi:hypothetical protein
MIGKKKYYSCINLHARAAILETDINNQQLVVSLVFLKQSFKVSTTVELVDRRVRVAIVQDIILQLLRGDTLLLVDNLLVLVKCEMRDL